MLRAQQTRYRLLAGLIVIGCFFLHGALAAQQNNDQLKQLNYGYGMLYSNASGLAKVSDLLYVKTESDAVEHIVDAISNYADKLSGQLQKLHKRNPEIQIDATGMPEIAKQKLSAVEKDRAESLAPLVGKTGKKFERSLLLSMAGVLNQERHLAGVMMSSEHDARRKRFLKQVKSHYNSLYQHTMNLLNAQYFCR